MKVDSPEPQHTHTATHLQQHVQAQPYENEQHPPRACSTPHPQPLVRRHTSNYATALRRHSSIDPQQAAEGIAQLSTAQADEDVGPLDKAPLLAPEPTTLHIGDPATATDKRAELSCTPPTAQGEYSPEVTKRLLQRKSIALDAEKSQEEFNVKYNGVRRSSQEAAEQDAEVARLRELHEKAIKELTSQGSRHCKGAHECFHSNQDDNLPDPNIKGYYPQSFEYADFKRRMSFHD